MKLANWGNFPRVEAEVKSPSSPDGLRRIVAGSGEIIARGLGRCYGDSSLWRTVVSTLGLDRMIGFRESDGVLECEAGVSLAEILDLFVPRGWFLPVVPGTKFVTVGGAIASDVHGKNHHKVGSFSNHVLGMDILLSDGEVVACSREKNADLFRATCGGMGLCGIILRASFRLIPVESSFVRRETVKADGIDAVMSLFDESSGWSYSVAWIDCLSRGKARGRAILTRGEHAAANDAPGRSRASGPPALPGKRRINIPFDVPGFVLNGLSAKAFNFLYHRKAPRERSVTVVDLDTFFFPLDMIGGWNRIYGASGFLQYQFVLPREASREGLAAVLGRIAKSSHVPFLAVLKLLGPREGEGLIPFPMEGYTLALDFPVRDGIFPFLDKLDDIVISCGGRHYLTKDARMGPKVFEAGYPGAGRFRGEKMRFDGNRRFRSLQSKRLEI